MNEKKENSVNAAEAVPILSGESDDPNWLIENWLMSGRMTALSGEAQSGKSTLALKLATASIRHKDNPFGRNALFASWTEQNGEHARRARRMPDMSKDRKSVKWLADHLHTIERIGCPPMTESGKLTPDGGHLLSECERLRARLLILDPAEAAFGSGEEFARAVEIGNWARKNDCAVLIVDWPLEDWPDWPVHVIWHLQRKPEGAQVKCVKNKLVPELAPMPAPWTLHGKDPAQWNRVPG